MSTTRGTPLGASTRLMGGYQGGGHCAKASRTGSSWRPTNCRGAPCPPLRRVHSRRRACFACRHLVRNLRKTRSQGYTNLQRQGGCSQGASPSLPCAHVKLPAAFPRMRAHSCANAILLSCTPKAPTGSRKPAVPNGCSTRAGRCAQGLCQPWPWPRCLQEVCGLHDCTQIRVQTTRNEATCLDTEGYNQLFDGSMSNGNPGAGLGRCHNAKEGQTVGCVCRAPLPLWAQ